MKITVTIVCLNEEKNITPCLKSLLNQSWDHKDYEILVVDNNSIDKTCKIVKNWQKRLFPSHAEFSSASLRQRFKTLKQVQSDTRASIRLIINPKRGIAISRNVAVKKAKYPLIAFTDADCVASKDWLKELMKGYSKYKAENSAVIAVGGSNTSPKTTPFCEALGIMLNTFLGSRGSVQARCYSQDRYVPHLSCANVLYEKEKIMEIGGFDETFGSIIEDEDLSSRLLKKGYQFVYLTKAKVSHKMADNFYFWAKKMFIYGKGRMWFLLKHPGRWHLYFLLPIILVLTIPISLPIYLIVMFIYSFWEAGKSKRLDLLPRIYGLLVITHFSYGLGEIYGFFKRRQISPRR